MKTCYALRHVPFESLGLMGPVLAQRGFEIRVVDVPVTGLAIAELEAAELVVVLGGPVSVYEEELYPFLTEELQLLESRLKKGNPTLGICLGAQLMAKALGARVYPGSQKEIGWSKLVLSAEGQRSVLSTVTDQHVLHWHGDTFDIPAGATLLASTDITPHQAFAWQGVALALQFHLEVTEAELEAWYVGHAAELGQWGKLTVPELRAQGRRFAPQLRRNATQAFEAMLDQWMKVAR